MADFMTVLAAAQKLAPTAAHGKALAGLLPEGLFENVLSEQLGVAQDAPQLLPTLAAAMPPALSASSEQISLGDKPLTRKPVPVAPTIQEQVPDAVLIPPTLAEPVVRDKPVSAAADVPVAGKDAPVARDLQVKAGLEMAATPAAAAAGQRQDLPLSPQVFTAMGGQVVAQTEATSGVAPLLAATTTPSEPLRSPDASTLVAARQLGQFDSAARPVETSVRVALETPVRSQGFPAEFSEKIVWLAGRQSQVADLTLNPPQLGALEVRLSLTGGEAGAQFYSPHPVVREAIEAALPKLRELMAQAGITLGDAQVRDEAFARGDAGGNGARGGSGAAGEEATASLVAATTGASRTGLGLIDLYA